MTDISDEDVDRYALMIWAEQHPGSAKAGVTISSSELDPLRRGVMAVLTAVGYKSQANPPTIAAPATASQTAVMGNHIE